MIPVGLSTFLIPREILSRWDLLRSHFHLCGMKDPWEYFSQRSYGFIPVGLSFSIIRFKIWMKVALHWWPLLSFFKKKFYFYFILLYNTVLVLPYLYFHRDHPSNNLSDAFLFMWWTSVPYYSKFLFSGGLGIILCDFFLFSVHWNFLSMNMVLSNQFIGYKLSLTWFWCQFPGIFKNFILVEMTLTRIQQSPLLGDVHSHILKDQSIHKQDRWRNSWTICRQCWDSAPGM